MKQVRENARARFARQREEFQQLFLATRAEARQSAEEADAASVAATSGCGNSIRVEESAAAAVAVEGTGDGVGLGIRGGGSGGNGSSGGRKAKRTSRPRTTGDNVV